MEVAVLHRVIERLDAKPVADEHQAVFIFAPEGGGEHAAEACEAICIPLRKGAQRDFGITVDSQTDGRALPTLCGSRRDCKFRR